MFGLFLDPLDVARAMDGSSQIPHAGTSLGLEVCFVVSPYKGRGGSMSCPDPKDMDDSAWSLEASIL